MTSSSSKALLEELIHDTFTTRHKRLTRAVEHGELSKAEREHLDKLIGKIVQLKKLVPDDWRDEPDPPRHDYYARRADAWLFEHSYDGRFSPAIFEALCERDLEDYRYITLSNLKLSTNHLDTILSNRKKVRLRLLDLSGNCLDDGFIPRFHRWFDVTTLEFLDLGQNPISFEAIEPFFSELTFPKLKKLRLPRYSGPESRLPSDDYEGLKIAFMNDHPDLELR